MRLWFHPNRIAGIAGCNSFWGRAAVEDGRLMTTDLGGTLVGCSDVLEDEQTWLATLLVSNPTITIDGPSIRFVGEGGSATFTDEEVADRDVPLEGTGWVFDAIESEGIGAPAAGTLTLDGGALQLDDGCTTGAADYTVDGAMLLVGPITWKPADCPGIVHTFTITAALAQPVSIDIAANRLTLESPDGTTMRLHIPR